METVIDILDFSNDPWGRTYEDNPTSNGNAFRTAFLTDAFRKYDKVTVDFFQITRRSRFCFLGRCICQFSQRRRLHL